MTRRAGHHPGTGAVLPVNVYTPNSRGVARLDYLMEWGKCLPGLPAQELDASKPVVVCGDLNVALKLISRIEANRRNAGFTDEGTAKDDGAAE